MEKKGQERKRKKRGMQFIPYDYEAAYSKSIEFMHEWILENMFSHGRKMVYALKEITAGEQFEIEIYPQFRKMDEVPKEGQRIVKDNSKAQKNLNDKNARKYVERLINQNFGDRDIWLTLTYDDDHLPPDGDIDAAIKNMQNYIRRVNYQRKKRGLPNAKYVYVTEYNEDAEIRWHHHIVMDGALDMDVVEGCWNQSSRNEVRRLQKDENGLTGMSRYMVKEATVGNYMVVLRNDPLVRESMKYNKLTGRIDIVKKLWWNEEICKLDDDGRTYFYYFFERYYKLTSEKCMDKALRIEANSRAYHPICEYLEQLEWDGQERIRYVLQRYMGADASDFVYEVVKHFLMEALSRIYRPGCKADEMLCLVGQQGAGKSTFFRFLALNDDWFSDDLKQLNDSKIYEHLRGHWIMEMSEMIAAISAKSNEEIKSFLTRQKDTYRNPYDKYEEDRKRQCVFAGSTNTRQFIPFDRTGARRFLPIAIDSSKAEKHILDDEKEARAYFEQLWAEAIEIYWSTENKNSLLKFSKEMEQEISEYRKQFTQEDTMAGMIQGWLDAYKGTHVCSVQIWKGAFDHFDREPKKFETNEICSIMDTQITGWKRAGVHRFSKEGYGRQRSWVREGTEEGGNEPDKDGFTKLTKAEQLELPFDLPDKEKG